jgi:hypothetical protein
MQQVNALIPKSDLPSYPSEDAVVAGVVGEMMKLLFPGDQDFIQQKIEEHKKARLIAGANVRSDLDAGEALGQEQLHKNFVQEQEVTEPALQVVALLSNLNLNRIVSQEARYHGIARKIQKRPGYANVIWKSKNMVV